MSMKQVTRRHYTKLCFHKASIHPDAICGDKEAY